jgi:hypothetical protein
MIFQRKMGTPTVHHQQHIEAALKAEFGTLHYAPEEENRKKRGRSHQHCQVRTVRIFFFSASCFALPLCLLPIDS